MHITLSPIGMNVLDDQNQRDFDDDSFDEVEENLRDIDPDEEDSPYFPLEGSKPPHY